MLYVILAGHNNSDYLVCVLLAVHSLRDQDPIMPDTVQTAVQKWFIIRNTFFFFLT